MSLLSSSLELSPRIVLRIQHRAVLARVLFLLLRKSRVNVAAVFRSSSSYFPPSSVPLLLLSLLQQLALTVLAPLLNVVKAVVVVVTFSTCAYVGRANME